MKGPCEPGGWLDLATWRGRLTLAALGFASGILNWIVIRWGCR